MTWGASLATEHPLSSLVGKTQSLLPSFLVGSASPDCFLWVPVSSLMFAWILLFREMTARLRAGDVRNKFIMQSLEFPGWLSSGNLSMVVSIPLVMGKKTGHLQGRSPPAVSFYFGLQSINALMWVMWRQWASTKTRSSEPWKPLPAFPRLPFYYPL